MDYPSAMGMVTTVSADPAPTVPEYDLDDVGNLILSPGLNSTFPNIFSVGGEPYGGPSQTDDGQDFDIDGSIGLLEEYIWASQGAPDYNRDGDINDLRLPASYEENEWTFQNGHVVSESVDESGSPHGNGAGSLDEKCQRDIFEPVDPKCPCGTCTSRAFMKDIDTLGVNIPDVQHVFSYQDPTDNMEVDEPTLLPQYERPIDQAYLPLSPGYRPHETSTRLPSRKKKKKRNVPDRTAKEMLELLILCQKAFESNTALPEEESNRLRQVTSGIKPLRRSSASLTTEPKRVDPDVSQSDRISTPLRQSSPSNTRNGPPFSSHSVLRELPAATANVSPSVMNTTVQQRAKILQAPHTIHHCTFGLCPKSYNCKSDWKRHEESVHKKRRYMCGKCSSGHNHPLGGYACGFCMGLQPFPSLESVKWHTLGCSDAKEQATSYSRPDHLREHIRDEHGMDQIQADSFDWVFDAGLDEGWLRECGFCGIGFNDFDFRADHISEQHYKQGADFKDWRIPFQQEVETEFRGSSLDSSDETEDENDENENRNKDDDDDDDGDESDSDSDNDGHDQRANRSSRSDNRQQPADSYNTQNGTTDYTGYTSAAMLPGINNYGSATATYGDDLYCLHRYVASDEQHERLLLGIGRKPFHVIIGQRVRTEQARVSLPSNSSETQNSSLSPARSKTLKNSQDIPDLNVTEVEHSSQDPPQTCTALQIRHPAWRHGPLTERVSDFILDKEQPYTLGYAPVLANLLENQSASTLILGNEIRTRAFMTWTVSSGTSSSTLTSHSQTSKTWCSSLASTVDTHGIVPWNIQVIDDADTIGSVTQDLDDQMWWLPCEFAFNGCDVRFPPSRYADWVAHSLSHFLGHLPSKAVCWFCDEKEGIFEAHGNFVSSWATRLQHISEHLEMGLSVDDMRPDYWLVEHLWKTGLLAAEDYQSAIQYSERPPCTGLIPLGHETEAMLQKRERSLLQLYDLVKERRQSRGKKVARYLSSQTSCGIGHEQLESQCRVTELPSDEDVLAEDENTEDQSISTLTLSPIHEEQNGDEGPTYTASRSQDRLAHTEEPNTPPYFEPIKEAGAVSIESLLPMSQESLEHIGTLSTVSSEKDTISPSTFSDLTSLSASESSKQSSRDCSTKSRKSSGRSQHLKPIIHSRDSSTASIYSKSSSEHRSYMSSSSSSSYVDKDERTVRRRVPDNEKHYMTSTSSPSGYVLVHAHGSRYYDPNEPRASEALSGDYKRTKESARRR